MIQLFRVAVMEAHRKGKLESLAVRVEMTQDGLKMDYTTSEDRKDYILGRKAVKVRTVG